jgi:hypothetical protein
MATVEERRRQEQNAQFGGVTQRQRENLGMGPPSPTKPASAIYGNSGVREGIAGALPGLKRAAFDQATQIKSAQRERGPIAGATAGIRSIGPLAAGLGSDVVRGVDFLTRKPAKFLDELVTGDSSNPLTLGQVFSGGRSAPAPAPAPERATQVPLEGELMPRDDTSSPSPTPPERFGYISSADGRRSLSVNGNTEADILGRVNTFDNRSALDEFGRANAIRQQAVDAQPRGAGIVDPSAVDPVTDVYNRAEALMQRALNTRGPDRSTLIRSAMALGDQAETLAGLEGRRIGNEGMLQQTALSNQGDLDRTRAANQGAMDETTARGRYSLMQQALANLGYVESAQARSAGQTGIDRGTFETLVDSGVIPVDEETGQVDPENPRTAFFLRMLLGDAATQMPRMANGGVVPSAMAFANGGMVGGANTPSMPELDEYQAYSRSAREKGLDPVGFDQFLNLRGAAAQRETPIGMAGGGMVPSAGAADASGKMVVDPDPNAPTDSIPAMIDGQQPAKLDSGEFVVPRDVVMFYGTDKLQKMIEKARKPADGGQSNSAGVSAIQSAGG